MAVRPIRMYGHPVLRRKAEPVKAMRPEIQTLVDDMIETMYDALGLGLAAPQIGVSLRLMVLEDERRGAKVLINPEIAERRGEQVGEEGCLSIPGLYGQVARAEHVRVTALDRNWEPFSMEGRDLLARAIQHEIDHLDGILFIDQLDPVQRDRIKRRIKKEGLAAEPHHSALAL